MHLVVCDICQKAAPAPAGTHNRDRCSLEAMRRSRSSARGDQLPCTVPTETVQDKLLMDVAYGTIVPYQGTVMRRTCEQKRGQLQSELFSPPQAVIPPNINAALMYAKPLLGVKALSPEMQPMTASTCSWDERRLSGGPIIATAMVGTAYGG